MLKRLKIRHFKTQLGLLFAGLVALWLTAVIGYFVEEQANAVYQNRGQTIHAMALAASQLLSTEVEERSLEIDALASSLPLISDSLGSDKVLTMLALRKTRHNEYLWIGIGAPDGKVIQATDGILLGADVTARPWFKAGMASPYAGDVHEAVLLAKHLPQQKPNQPLRFIDFASPIKDSGGNVQGVLAAHASWDWVSEVIVQKVRESDPISKIEVMITNSKGVILYPFEKVGAPNVPKLAMSDRPFQILEWAEEGRFVTSVVPVKSAAALNLDWQVVVREPSDLALAPVRQLRLRLVIIGLGSAILCAFISYLVVARALKPIEKLALVATRVTRQEENIVFPDPATAGSEELAQLYASFHRMTASLLDREQKLKELNASLEQQVADRTIALTEANARLTELAARDPLTGLANRRCFEDHLVRAFQHFQRNGLAYSILMIDVDFFKQVNDTYGHAIGDQVLMQLANILSNSIRSTDLVARYGGEEFIVLLGPATSQEQAHIVAEKIRTSIAAESFPRVGEITISLGLAAANPKDEHQEDAVKRADTALYRAKQAGRNRVCVG